VRIAGPQPGTFPAQWAALTLNLGASQLVCTAGPPRPGGMPEDMPNRISDKMRKDIPDKIL